MSLQTSITLNSSQYVNEMKKVGDKSKEALERVKKTSQEASQALGKGMNESSSAMGAFTDKVKVAGISIKDLKDAFSDSANSAAALGNIYLAAFQLILKAVSAYNDSLKRTEEHEKKINDLLAEREKLQNSYKVEDTKSTSDKMQELLKLKENWTGSEEDKAKEKILVREIELLQKSLNEQDRIAIAINGQVVAQDKLAKAIAHTLYAERQLKMEALRNDYDKNLERYDKLHSRFKEKGVNSGYLDNISNILGRLSEGDFSDFTTFENIDLRLMRQYGEEMYQLTNTMIKQAREYKKLNDQNHIGADFYSLWAARTSDRQSKEWQTRAEKQQEKAKEDEQKRRDLAQKQEQAADAKTAAQRKWENTYIEDKNELAYKQGMDALSDEVKRMREVKGADGKLLVETDEDYNYKTIRYGENMQKKLKKQYEENAVSDFLSSNRISDEVVKTNELTRKGGFQGGAVVIDNTQKQMLELQKGIRQVLEEVRKNTKGIEEKL